MDPETSLTPFTPWTPEQIEERIAAVRSMDTLDLKDLAESLSEGIEDTPTPMQAYYHAVRAELAARVPIPPWEYDSRSPATPKERVRARENIRTLPDALLDELIEALTLEPGEGELPADMAEDLRWMVEERDARRAGPPPPPAS